MTGDEFELEKARFRPYFGRSVNADGTDSLDGFPVEGADDEGEEREPRRPLPYGTPGIQGPVRPPRRSGLTRQASVPSPSLSARPRVFISYRREDTAFQATPLYELLCDALGGDRVFKDVDSIEIGATFFDAIDKALRSCNVVLVLIGDRWLARNTVGQRRIDDLNDLVRFEVATALTMGKRVVPVLIGTPPSILQDLPKPIATLADRQAVEISASRFTLGIEKLVRDITCLP